MYLLYRPLKAVVALSGPSIPYIYTDALMFMSAPSNTFSLKSHRGSDTMGVCGLRRRTHSCRWMSDGMLIPVPAGPTLTVPRGSNLSRRLTSRRVLTLKTNGGYTFHGTPCMVI